MFSCMLATFAPWSRPQPTNDVEVEEREAACHSVETYLDQFRDFSSPDKDEEVSSTLKFLVKT
jgi:hypothetical protein